MKIEYKEGLNSFAPKEWPKKSRPAEGGTTGGPQERIFDNLMSPVSFWDGQILLAMGFRREDG